MGENPEIEEEYPEKMRIPAGKRYGILNGALKLLDEAEVIERYAMPFEEMSDAFRRGVGLFKLPENWLPKDGELFGTARWRAEQCCQTTCYYF